MKRAGFYIFLSSLSLFCLLASCKKDYGKGSNQFIIGHYSLTLSAINSNDTSTKANMLMNIMTDSLLYYDIFFDSIPDGEKPTSYTIYTKNTSDNDSVLLEHTITDFNKNESIGSNKLSATLYTKLIEQSDSIYVKINTTNYSDGLVQSLIEF